MDSEILISGDRLNRGRLVRLGDFVLRPVDEDPSIELLMIEVGKVFAGIPVTLCAWLDPSGVRQVVCHGDTGPGNRVFREGKAFAVIDWEMSAPGRRSWDLATAPRLQTVKLLLLNQKTQAAYVITRIKDRGESLFEEWVVKGGIRRLELDEAWISGESERLMQDWRL